MIEFIKIIINVHNMNNMRKLIYGLLAVLVIATLWLSVGSLDKSSKQGAPPALPELNVGSNFTGSTTLDDLSDFFLRLNPADFSCAQAPEVAPKSGQWSLVSVPEDVTVSRFLARFTGKNDFYLMLSFDPVDQKWVEYGSKAFENARNIVKVVERSEFASTIIPANTDLIVLSLQDVEVCPVQATRDYKYIPFRSGFILSNVPNGFFDEDVIAVYDFFTLSEVSMDRVTGLRAGSYWMEIDITDGRVFGEPRAIASGSSSQQSGGQSGTTQGSTSGSGSSSSSGSSGSSSGSSSSSSSSSSGSGSSSSGSDSRRSGRTLVTSTEEFLMGVESITSAVMPVNSEVTMDSNNLRFDAYELTVDYSDNSFVKEIALNMPLINAAFDSGNLLEVAMTYSGASKVEMQELFERDENRGLVLRLNSSLRSFLQKDNVQGVLSFVFRSDEDFLNLILDNSINKALSGSIEFVFVDNQRESHALDSINFVYNDLDADDIPDFLDDDRDGDDVVNADDNCPDVLNPNQENTDGVADGGDACDDDDDNDGTPDADDDFPLDAAEDTDTDGDTIGDNADDDDDGDGFSDSIEELCFSDPLDDAVVPANNDGDAECDALDDDDDNDGLTDVEEDVLGTSPFNADTDGDTVRDGNLAADGSAMVPDNCPLVDNLNQDDQDGDGEGDACDGDTDGDGIENDADNCPLVSNSLQEDLDRDNEGDACDDDIDGDTHKNSYEDACGSDSGDAASVPDDNEGDGVCDALDDDDDNDRLTDVEEVALGTDPLREDTDGDGLSDFEEVRTHGTNPLLGDQDADGLNDRLEVALGTDFDNPDTDGDGIEDGDEDANQNGVVDPDETDPKNPDSDGDGENDFVEGAHLIPPTDTDRDGIIDARESSIIDSDSDGVFDEFDAQNDDSSNDTDGDGLTNIQEKNLGLDPLEGDTDGDLIPDDVEVGNVANPHDVDEDGVIDALEHNTNDDDNDGVRNIEDEDNDNPFNDDDSDGLPNILERQIGSNPLLDDTDGDGRDDALESGIDINQDVVGLDVDNDNSLSDAELQVVRGLAAAVPNTDGAGLPDVLESNIEDEDSDGVSDERDAENNDPSNDTDGDGISNRVEKAHCMNPLSDDTDGDGIPDAVEAVDLNDPVNTDDQEDFEVAIPFIHADGEVCISFSDANDLDSDDDGIADSEEVGDDVNNPVNTDGEDEPDYRDIDSDNDGFLDIEEVGNVNNPVNTDGVDEPDYRDTDSDNDGILDGELDATGNQIGFDNCRLTQNPGQEDADGDGIGDDCDTDSDDDSVIDTADNCPLVANVDQENLDGDSAGDACDGDIDGDKLGNELEVDLGIDPEDVDSDDDGLSDAQEVLIFVDGADTDANGVLSQDELIAIVTQLDTDNDGFVSLAEFEAGMDVDENGAPLLFMDWFVPSVFAEHLIAALDTDGDGTIDALDSDSDNDGLGDDLELSLGLNPRSSDSDGDGIEDAVEVGVDDDGDGTFNEDVSDADTDGILTVVEFGDREPVSSDDDGVIDALDTDSDNDQIEDAVEFALGMDPTSPDSDSDGIADADEFGEGEDPLDTDNDNIIDALDSDSDNDGIPDLDDDNSLVNDVDDDGILDGTELELGLSFDESTGGDSDSDGVSDFEELITDDYESTDDPIGFPELFEMYGIAIETTETVTTEGSIITRNISAAIVELIILLDADGDGEIDALESSILDSDSDGVVDEFDAANSNPTNDTDGDGLANNFECGASEAGHAEDCEPTDPLLADSDLDGYSDGPEVPEGSELEAGDNCVVVANPSQSDYDEDQVGDVCDDDRDGDNVKDLDADGKFVDRCPYTPLRDVVIEHMIPTARLVGLSRRNLAKLVFKNIAESELLDYEYRVNEEGCLDIDNDNMFFHDLNLVGDRGLTSELDLVPYNSADVGRSRSQLGIGLTVQASGKFDLVFEDIEASTRDPLILFKKCEDKSGTLHTYFAYSRRTDQARIEVPANKICTVGIRGDSGSVNIGSVFIDPGTTRNLGLDLFSFGYFGFADLTQFFEQVAEIQFNGEPFADFTFVRNLDLMFNKTGFSTRSVTRDNSDEINFEMFKSFDSGANLKQGGGIFEEIDLNRNILKFGDNSVVAPYSFLFSLDKNSLVDLSRSDSSIRNLIPRDEE